MIRRRPAPVDRAALAAELLARTRYRDESGLRELIDSGDDWYAPPRLVELLVERRDVPALRELAFAGDSYAFVAVFRAGSDWCDEDELELADRRRTAALLLEGSRLIDGLVGDTAAVSNDISGSAGTVRPELLLKCAQWLMPRDAGASWWAEMTSMLAEADPAEQRAFRRSYWRSAPRTVVESWGNRRRVTAREETS